jgi:hypothetical protein
MKKMNKDVAEKDRRKAHRECVYVDLFANLTFEEFCRLSMRFDNPIENGICSKCGEVAEKYQTECSCLTRERLKEESYFRSLEAV